MTVLYCEECKRWLGAEKGARCPGCNKPLSPGRLLSKKEHVRKFFEVSPEFKDSEEIVEMVAGSGAIFEVMDPKIIESLLAQPDEFVPLTSGKEE